MDHEKEAAVLRIAELSRRVGLSEHVLRAWESRYGLLKPVRSAGGYQLYSEDDQRRVRRMQVHLAGGLATAQAAQAAIAEEDRKSPRIDGRVSGEGVCAAHRANMADSADSLREAFDEMDEPAAQKVLDRLLTDLTVESLLLDATGERN